MNPAARAFEMATTFVKRNRTALTEITMVRGPDGRMVRKKTIPTLAPMLPKAAVRASAVQCRVLAEESREMLLDRIHAGWLTPTTNGYAPQRVVERPPVLRKPNVFRDRRPFRWRGRAGQLSQRYANWKAKHELDGRMLLATGEYTEAIEVYRGEQTKGGVYYMVRLKQGTHEPSGLTYNVLARVLELGSGRHNIPPRPHWKPTVRDIVLRFEQEAETIRAQALREALRAIR